MTVKNKNTNNNKILTTIALTALMLFVPLTIATNSNTGLQSAFATGATGTLDPNGLMRLDPLAGYTYSIGNEFYTDTAIKNFRSDGSERIDFKGHETDSLILAGYVNVIKGAGNNSNICSEQPTEEISTKINGGFHSSDAVNDISSPTDITPWAGNPNAADTIDVGVINFAGTDGRVRTEPTHPNPLYDVPEASGSTHPSSNLCDVSPDDWIGFMTIKVNRDTNCGPAGKYDDVWISNYIDVSGLDANGKPQNKWLPTQGGFKTVAVIMDPDQTDAQIGPIKSLFQYWGQYASVNHPSDTYQTLRIDHQSQAAWQNDADPPYKFVTLKQIINIHNDDCPTINGANPGPRYPGTDDTGLAAMSTDTTAAPAAIEGTSTEDAAASSPSSATTDSGTQDDLAQSEDPQSEDNNDETADDSGNSDNNEDNSNDNNSNDDKDNKVKDQDNNNNDD